MTKTIFIHGPCLFQEREIISSVGWETAPGVIGVVRLFKSQMKISDSEAPEASKFF